MNLQFYRLPDAPPEAVFVRNKLRAAQAPEMLRSRDADLPALIIRAVLTLADHGIVPVVHVVGKVIRDVIGCRLRIGHTASEDIVLNPDHTVSGSYEGTWELKEGQEAVIVLNGIEYRGQWIVEWDQYGYKDVVTFTALSDKGYAVWGSGYTAQ